MDDNRRYEAFVRNRITELREQKGVSEHRMSLELGKSGSYIRSITNGISMPSLRELFNIRATVHRRLPAPGVPAAVQFPVLLAQRHPTSVGRAGGRRWAYAPDGWHTGTPFSQTRCLPQYLLHRERRCKSVFLCSFRRPHCLYHGAGGVDR